MGKMKEEKMRTMYFQNLEMKEYVKKGKGREGEAMREEMRGREEVKGKGRREG